jgi:glycosyltransferase involved in cell wall biosynthesis
MTLIWLSHFIPFPPRGGAPQRSYHLLRQTSRHHETILIAFNRPVVEGETLEAYSAELRKFCADVEIWELPFPWRGARWWAGLLGNAMQTLPHACEVYRSQALLHRWDDILRTHSDALVHIDSSDLAAFVPAAMGHRVLLNHHNCESAMAERRARVEPNLAKRFFFTTQSKRQAALERNLCAAVAVNAVVSPEDGECLRRECPSAHVHVVANGTDTDYFTPDPKSIKPNTLVFAGSLGWYPNVSGLRFFRSRIWPKLKQCVPGLECILAGKSPVPELKGWATSDSAITLVDSPDDIRPWIARGGVFICPIVDGGGTRLKLLDAMSCGKAIVSTEIGAEGLGLESGKHAMIAESDDQFVDMTLSLLRDSSLRSLLGRNARVYVESHFGWDTIGKSLEAAYDCPGPYAHQLARK